ncbi:MAG: cation:proton antiporter [Thermoproteales archaeon]|nr:cation:proton antiporter [Thermoproteales archaeon]
MEPIVYKELSSLLHLLIAAALAIVYAKSRAVVILPALMLASLLGVALGFEVHPFIIGISGFAAALIVFIAGLELDPHFLRMEKERILIMFVFEAILMLSLFYTLTFFLSLTLAVTLIAIMIASNEAFVVELAKSGGGKLSHYGITLSVLEDALAVFLLSVGFFTSASLKIPMEEVGFLISISITLIPVLYVLSKPFDNLIDTIQRNDTRVLLTILYMAVLMALAEVLKIPEAIPVFIGSVMLSLWEFNKETFKAIESYFILALMGFVASLPFTIENVGESFHPGLQTIFEAMILGIILALLAFIFRSIIVFFASLMGGLKITSSLKLSLSLANTGEFGLIVLASLIKTGGIPPNIAYAAMFAYAFNLTLVSIVVNNLDKVVNWLLKKPSRKIIEKLEVLSREADRFIQEASADREFKIGILELAITVTLVYAATGFLNLYKTPLTNYLLTIFLFSAFIVAIQEVFQRFSEDIKRFSITGGGIFAFIMKFLILYLVVAPIIHFIGTTYAVSGGAQLIIPLESPISLLLILIFSYTINLAVYRLSNLLVKSAPISENIKVEKAHSEGGQ